MRLVIIRLGGSITAVDKVVQTLQDNYKVISTRRTGISGGTKRTEMVLEVS